MAQRELLLFRPVCGSGAISTSRVIIRREVNAAPKPALTRFVDELVYQLVYTFASIRLCDRSGLSASMDSNAPPIG